MAIPVPQSVTAASTAATITLTGVLDTAGERRRLRFTIYNSGAYSAYLTRTASAVTPYLIRAGEVAQFEIEMAYGDTAKLYATSNSVCSVVVEDLGKLPGTP